MNGGRRAVAVRGAAETNRVRRTRASTWGFERGLSNAAVAGVAPARKRIHAAWRASTEWIATAAAYKGQAPLIDSANVLAAAARSSKATAVRRNESGSSVVPRKS